MLGIVSELFYQNRGYRLDVREMDEQTQSTAAAHDTDTRPEPAGLVKLYEIQQFMVSEAQDRIVICDDVLTTGCHFRAMEMVILAAISSATIRGMFLARRKPETVDFSDFYFDL